ncbi:hypothetical protein M409DRAFT_21994 [Zasmidium cellare ATCC 36951]|uniref:F-box domain-containing protein n=1 Tax=Zasmidium cellare ATCC 36951 TaxID=1080233 RepID=A0A6A6CNN2_ZASCE|nr:uncharacterized protein M409DRAFT_21994 [Zasmidium cellare ATCC 36951]KAF2167848.1 hypothetical protein M409DRAFT_21994 [Zasmidium cellare ATCC 36951]
MEKDNTTLINTVPQEVWDQIVQHSTLQDVLALRATCKKASKVCYACSRLYLHPTRLSDVVKLCNGESEFLKEAREGIVELVLLGTSAPAFQWQLQGEHPDLVQYRPWPRLGGGFPQTLVTTKEEVHETGTRSWETNYTPLLMALQEDYLPQLSSLIYATKADEEGYCAVPQTKMEFHALNSTKHQLDPECNDLYTQWSDLEMLCGVLTFSSRNFRTVKFTQMRERPCDLRWVSLGSDQETIIDDIGSASSRRTARTVASMSHAMGLVQHLTLPAASLTFHKDHWRELQALAGGLRSLTIDIDGPDPGCTDRDLWALQDYIAGQSAAGKQGPAHVEELNIRDHRDGPSCLEPEYVLQFLEFRKHSLQVVRFHNVFFCEMSGADRMVKRGMKSLIERSRSYGLRTVELRVPRLGLKETDRNDEFFEEYRPDESYHSADPNWCGRGLFDELAEELGVVERDGGWDFAVAVLPLDDDRESQGVSHFKDD